MNEAENSDEHLRPGTQSIWLEEAHDEGFVMR